MVDDDLVREARASHGGRDRAPALAERFDQEFLGFLDRLERPPPVDHPEAIALLHERRVPVPQRPVDLRRLSFRAEVRHIVAPRGDQLGLWIASRAREIGMRLDRDAAQVLADLVNGSVRENDVDRRRQTELAESELRLLALYRPGVAVRRGDVEALVEASSAVSTWAFLDAAATRNGRRAALLAGRLLASGKPVPVVVTQLHRRLRQLLEIRARLAGGATPADLVRLLRLNAYRAGILVGQARAWELHELEAALDGLLEVDLASKGTAADGRGSSAGMTGPLALGLWLADHVRPG